MRGESLLWFLLFGAIIGGLHIFLTGFASMVTLLAWSEATTNILYPTGWPFALFVIVLIITVDHEYFPTAGLVTLYFLLMVYHGKFSITTNFSAILWFLGGVVVYLLVGAIWLYVKWFSYLADPKNAAAIKSVPDGKETSFFISRIGYLYPHFLYWPFSVPHTLVTKLLFQLFEHFARRFSGTFAKMVVNRKNELKDQ